MTQINKSPKNSKQKIIVLALSIAVIVAAGVVVCVLLSRNDYLARTMRLLRAEGTVSIEDQKGGTKPVTVDSRFQSGDAVSTGSDGIASIGLDDTKIVTLNNDSRAEFVKNGKQLELKLTKGAVFFNVTEKLKSDEKFEIKTSTMTAGIRGTSGVVYYDEANGGNETIAVTDGAVEISATDPVSGETKTARVEGGQQLKVILSSSNGQRFELIVEDIEINDLSEFTLGMIAENEDLINRISGYTGWDPNKLKKTLKDLDNQGNPGESKPGESNPGTTKPTDALPTKPTDPEAPTGSNPPSSTSNSSKKRTSSKKRSTRRSTTSSKKKKKSSSRKSSQGGSSSIMVNESVMGVWSVN
ncbi:MAG: FecR domain-containing protein [Clostridiales bacterium]|nr:FecR domain-containing protein [Clostridiales bacterium]